MEYYVNHVQMKAVDTYSIRNTGIPSLVLMERAALSVAELVMEHFAPEDGRILSVCAMGNNGADGMAAARILALRGYRTAVLFAGNREKATEEWNIQLGILEKLGIPCTFVSDSNGKTVFEYINTEKTQVLIDGLFGIGLTRKVTGVYAELIDAMNESGIPVVSVDIPSGIDSDSGKIAGTAVKAWVTVTFGRKKTGQIFYPGAEYCGMIKVCEIGFAPEALEKAGYDAFGYTKSDLRHLVRPRPADSHKGTFGRILIIAGSETMAGAAVFSARAAYRMGCGLVKIHTVRENRVCMHQMVPEAILSLYDGENYDMELLRRDCEWADVVVFGPGMGQKSHVHQILEYLLTSCRCPMVFDADGLRVLSGHREWYCLLSDRMILTPHMGEMAALTGAEIPEIQKNPAKTACDFAERFECICVLKGARTIVAQKGQPCYLNTSGCSAMATAGSGDVLTGVLAGFLAEGHSCSEAASLGVYLHGLAGEAAAGKYGNRAVMATDLTESIGDVLKEISECR